MLNPDHLEQLPNSVMALFQQVEEDILQDMARRITKIDGMTETAAFQAWRLQETQLFRRDIVSQLSKLTGKTKAELRNLFQQAGTQKLEQDDAIYRAVGLSPPPPNESPELVNLLNAGMLQTNGTFQNITATTANTATRQFENALDRAWLQIASGAFDYQTAIRRAIKDLAISGLQSIQYPNGHVDTLEVAVRRAVLTGVNQTAAKLSEARADEMDCDLVEVTAKAGARTGVGVANHAGWQGKVYSLSGKSSKYPSLVEVTGYGTGPGLCGWNCGHDFYPFFEGISQPAISEEELDRLNNATVEYNGETIPLYDATQKQRSIERQIRRWKKEYLMLDAAGLDATQASAKLAHWREVEKDFCRQTGLYRDNARSQVNGFGRSQASRARWQNQKEVDKYSQLRYNKDGTIIVTDDWTSKKSPHLEPTYKPNAVIDTVSKGGKQRDRMIYDEEGRQKTQISNGPHANPKNHPFGEHGEHAHDIIWENGKIVSRTPRNLTDQERKEHADIL